eukprot:8449197-Heterocapsa_arctica.AAC.1
MLVVEQERFEHARNVITNKSRDAMSAPSDGDKGEGKSKGCSTPPADADGQPPWHVENGKDKRADKPCHFLAA